MPIREIPEPGLLRDREIAEIKGIYQSYTVYGLMIKKRWNGSTIVVDAPKWSTRRDDSWELWDELPFDKRYDESKGGTHQITIKLPWFGETQYYSGKDFADAVSRAWLTWQLIERGEYIVNSKHT